MTTPQFHYRTINGRKCVLRPLKRVDAPNANYYDGMALVAVLKPADTFEAWLERWQEKQPPIIKRPRGRPKGWVAPHNKGIPAPKFVKKTNKEHFKENPELIGTFNGIINK